jgi:hypothetical protein
VLRILSPLKIHRPRPDLNLRTLCPLASTITTKLPRTAYLDLRNSVEVRNLEYLEYSYTSDLVSVM